MHVALVLPFGGFTLPRAAKGVGLAYAYNEGERPTVVFLICHISAGPAETVGQVGHLPYHFLVVHTGNDVCDDFYPR